MLSRKLLDKQHIAKLLTELEKIPIPRDKKERLRVLSHLFRKLSTSTFVTKSISPLMVTSASDRISRRVLVQYCKVYCLWDEN